MSSCSSSSSSSEESAGDLEVVGRKRQRPDNDHSSSSDEEEEQLQLQIPITRRVGKRRVPVRALVQRKQQKKKKRQMDSDSDWESEQSETEKKEKLKSTTSTSTTTTTSSSKGPTKQKAVPKINQPCSEVLFSSHVLAEQVKTYIHQNQDSINSVEKQQLEKWLRNVQIELQEQNQAVLKNIHLVTHLRKIGRRRNKLQDKLLLKKKTVQSIQQQTVATQGQVLHARKHDSKTDSANQFLQSLQSLPRSS